jgi:hypothetical protein
MHVEAVSVGGLFHLSAWISVIHYLTEDKMADYAVG